jgi:hypothetical protein
MLDLFDIIMEAHRKAGHMMVERTKQMAKKTYYSVTEELVRTYQCFVCMQKTPIVPAHKGAKKPIISSEFCDRFQADLIDMRTQRKPDIYGVMQRWILTVKDHSTGLIYLSSLPFKKARFVAFELEKYFGFVSYSHIFHTDNGKEFIATTVVRLLQDNNPHCFVVTGQPRTPRDQGSVENGNKLVKRVMQAILAERRSIPGLDDNWTRILGEIMGVCNSHEGRRMYSVSSYLAVYGQEYYQEIKCPIETMRECKTISQRLCLSRDERLEKYVTENGIVDVDYNSDDEFVDEMRDGNNDIINCGNDDADGSEDSMMSEEGVPEVENPVVVDIDIAPVPPSVVGPEDCGENRKAPPEGLFAGDLSEDWITNPADFFE